MVAWLAESPIEFARYFTNTKYEESHRAVGTVPRTRAVTAMWYSSVGLAFISRHGSLADASLLSLAGSTTASHPRNSCRSRVRGRPGTRYETSASCVEKCQAREAARSTAFS